MHPAAVRRRRRRRRRRRVVVLITSPSRTVAAAEGSKRATLPKLLLQYPSNEPLAVAAAAAVARLHRCHHHAFGSGATHFEALRQQLAPILLLRLRIRNAILIPLKQQILLPILGPSKTFALFFLLTRSLHQIRTYSAYKRTPLITPPILNPLISPAAPVFFFFFLLESSASSSSSSSSAFYIQRVAAAMESTVV